MHKRSRLIANLVQGVLASALVVGFLVVVLWEGAPEAADRGTHASDSPIGASDSPVEAATKDSDTRAGDTKGRTKLSPRDGKLLLGPRTELKARPKPKLPTHRTIPDFTFRIASFNVLGHKHTERGGHKASLPGSAQRMGGTIGAWGRQGIDVVGTQEMQPENIAAFHRQGGGTYAIWPGSGHGREAGANSVVWRRSTFAFVEGRFLTVPYLGGKPWPMPYVKLRHLATGRDIWIASFHNPADRGQPGFHGRMRSIALGKEVALANSLGADGTPVFFTGDFNDRAPAFCRITTGTALKAANGGSTGAGCAPPGRMDVDWVFGPDSVAFGGFASIKLPGISDHPLVVATATVPGRRERIPGR